MTIQFAMNRTCAPQLAFEEFIALVKTVGVGAVEIRNDIEGQEFLNGRSADDVRIRLEDADIKVASVNALQRFNEWTSERSQQAAALMSYASKLGAPGVVLCPVHNIDHGWSEVESEKNLRNGLAQLRPILLDAGIKGYVEPLGMAGSTMKQQSTATRAIDDIDGWDCFELCFDTFQYFRCGDVAIHANRVGLVHISGITRNDLSASQLTEPDRVLVENDDRVGNIVQIRNLIAQGYSGYVSMEPFNIGVQTSRNLAEQLMRSFKRVATALD